MSGVMWHLNTDHEFSMFQQHCAMLRLAGRKIRVKFIAEVDPKTSKQIRYAHSLCGALAEYRNATMEQAKLDSKKEFGVVKVYTSLFGDRTARLVSFSDYSKNEMTAYITSFEVYLDENSIPYSHPGH